MGSMEQRSYFGQIRVAGFRKYDALLVLLKGTKRVSVLL